MIFEPIEMTDVEQNIVAQNLAHPAVQKYLRKLAQTAASDLVTQPNLVMEEDASYVKKHAFIMGGIGVLDDLIHIGNVVNSSTN